MGVDCNLYLPYEVDISEVSDVVALLLGNDGEMFDLSSHEGSKYLKTSGFEYSTYNEWGFLIHFKVPILKNVDSFMYMYFHESKKGKLLKCRSTALALALSVELIDFFGGKVDFNDCDDVDYDYIQNPPAILCPESGDEWQSWQWKKFNLKPLTKRQVLSYNEQVAYENEYVFKI